MAADDPRPNTPQKSNPDRLRSEIDAGRTGDKVPFDDPAAAPLGTDSEAGGHPATPADVRTARANETPAPESGSASPAVTKEYRRTPSGDMRRPLGIGVSIAVAAVAVVLVIVVVAFLA